MSRDVLADLFSPAVRARVIPTGPLAEKDEYGIPWRASIVHDSPHYFKFPEGFVPIILIDGLQVIRGGVVEYDRRDGWLLIQDWKKEREPVKVYGKVEVFAPKRIRLKRVK